MTTLLLLGSGELGREIAIEAIRLGCTVVAADRYPDAPAMQVAQHSRVLDMTDPAALRALLGEVAADAVIPEVEALATGVLVEAEAAGVRVVPTARATLLTMDRAGIRQLAAVELGLPTSDFVFAHTEEEFLAAVATVGLPVVVKPVMSSSGKGQSVVRPGGDPLAAWRYARSAGRVAGQPVIVEGFVEFDHELTLLTVRHAGGTTICPPVGHVQVDGDYRESWQPAVCAPQTWAQASRIAETVTAALGGYGVFGVEVFVLADGQVLFSEVSPRPHDTGMVTLATQRLSEFALHARAVLGLPIHAEDVDVPRAGASAVVLGPAGLTGSYRVGGLAEALAQPGTQVRVFAKPETWPARRLAVALALGEDVEQARARARCAASLVTVTPPPG